MTSQSIIIMAVAVAIIAALAAGGGGPRITQITRTRRRKNGEPEDGVDA